MDTKMTITIWDSNNKQHEITCDRSKLKYSVRSGGVLEIDTGYKLLFVKDYTHIVIKEV